MLHQLARHDAIDLLNVARVQGFKDRALAWEVLVEGANADPSHLCNAIGRDGMEAFALQNSDHGVQYRANGLKCTALRWLAADRNSCGLQFHWIKRIQNMSLCLYLF